MNRNQFRKLRRDAAIAALTGAATSEEGAHYLVEQAWRIGQVFAMYAEQGGWNDQDKVRFGGEESLTDE